jgi:hypothetical protein
MRGKKRETERMIVDGQGRIREEGIRGIRHRRWWRGSRMEGREENLET